MNNLKNFRSNKGITLLDVIIYMIATLLVITLMTSVRNFFFKNLNVQQAAAKYAQEFDNFNAYFVKDVKNNTNIGIEKNGYEYTITLIPSNVKYSYKKRTNEEDENALGDIYRDSIKVASNVKSLSCEKNVIYIDNVQKVLLRLDIKIGGKSNNKTAFTKAIQYTFRYW